MEDAVLLSRMWLWLTVPGCLVGIALLVVGIVHLLRTIRVPELARLPLVAEQDVDLQDTGPLSFVIDKPRFRTVQASVFKPFALSVSLQDAAGKVIQAAPALMPMTVEGMSRTRSDIASLESIRPGPYRIRIEGLIADAADSDSFLVIARPVSKLAFVASILGIIAGAALTLGGLIASLATVVKFQHGG